MIEFPSIKHRSIKELFGSRIVDITKLESLSHNPFIRAFDCSLLEYIIDGEVAGQVITIPAEIIVYTNVLQVCAGSGLSVEKRFRGQGVAGELTKERMRLSRDKIAIASGLSSMSFPLFEKLGFVTFKYPRLIFLQKSRPVLEMFIKGPFLKITSSIVDTFLKLQKKLFWSLSIYRKSGIRIEEIPIATEEIAHIVNTDVHPFRENHTKEWFNWILKYPFTDDSRAKQHLFVIKHEEKVQAFFMTKERFHEQASHRGFKNVILGSVIEWGVLPDSNLTEIQICKAAVLSFGKHVDAVEICTENRTLIKSLKLQGLIQVGESNFAVKASEDSLFFKYKTEYSQISNWRIRPAMSDNGLS